MGEVLTWQCEILMTNCVHPLPFNNPHTPVLRVPMVTTPAAAAAASTTTPMPMPTTRTMITGTHHQCDDWQHPQCPGNNGGGYPYYLVSFVCLEAIIFDFISWCNLVPTLLYCLVTSSYYLWLPSCNVTKKSCRGHKKGCAKAKKKKVTLITLNICVCFWYRWSVIGNSVPINLSIIVDLYIMLGFYFYKLLFV